MRDDTEASSASLPESLDSASVGSAGGPRHLAVNTQQLISYKQARYRQSPTATDTDRC